MSFNSQLSAETQTYLQDKMVPQLIEHLFHELAVATPSDPLQFLAGLLEKQPKPRVFVIGTPCAGKSTLCARLAETFGVPAIAFEETLASANEGALGDEASELAKQIAAAAAATGGGGGGAGNSGALCAQLVALAAKKAVADVGGWILDGFPRTRAEAVGLQAAGVLPGLVMNLEVADATAQSRVTDGMDAAALSAKARLYALNHTELLQCYPAGLRVAVDASVAAEDVYAQCEPKVAGTCA